MQGDPATTVWIVWVHETALVGFLLNRKVRRQLGDKLELFTFENLLDDAAEFGEETERIRSGLQRVGPWRVNPAAREIQHTGMRSNAFFVDLDEVDTRDKGTKQLIRAAHKSPDFISDADLGALARMLIHLDLFSVHW